VRYVVIEREAQPIAVLFHDYTDGSLACRSRKESFLQAFNAICSKLTVRFTAEDGVLRAVYTPPTDYGWLDQVVDRLCEDFWEIGEGGDLRNYERNIDEIAIKYLA